MPAYTCPHCHQPFNVPATSSTPQGRCPHCQRAVALPKTNASRWFYARSKKKYGPYTWQQLRELAKSGVLRADDMLLQEGSRHWVRAGTLPTLFAGVAPLAQPAAPEVGASSFPRRPFPWLYVALTGVAACVLLGFAVFAYAYFRGDKTDDSQPENTDPDGDPPKNDGADAKTEDKKKSPQEKMPLTIPRADWPDQLVEGLNRQRRSAGLGSVTLDAELSRGCLAHAKYLARHTESANLQEEDPQKPGYSAEGRAVGQNALVARAVPPAALDTWMGRLLDRSVLLTPQVQRIGLGFASSDKGEWLCVVDATRGRGEPIVIFPASKQTDVPLAFTGGPEVPDAKATAGFPVTLMFPPSRKVTGAVIEMRDEKNKLVDGWTWTPEKLVPGDRQHNTIALIPKGLLQRGTVYQMKASALVDGQKWSQAWSFRAEDDGDTTGAWAKKALAKVNAYRKHAGLKPVALDDKQTRGCLAHARYLVTNEGHPSLKGLKAHEEDMTLPGSSEEGDRAGKASDIAIGDYEPTDGVDAWMATLYHRVPILEPNLKTIGFGCARGKQGWATVMNVSSGRAKEPRPHAVFYPVPEQTDVQPNFPNGGEEPNPIPDEKATRAGYPITAFFPKSEPLLDAIGKLTDAQGTAVPCWFSTLEMPANPKFKSLQDTTVCLIPRTPLAVNTTYHVHLQGQLAGKPWDKKWKFTTGAAGLSVPEAARAVLDRLNHYRGLAGLNAVTLDEAYTRGCQQHAEYLTKNADVLMKTVNDEDENLPGFTREGLQAAQNSDVFTNAPTPINQIDDLMATFTRRVYLLDPTLQRIGVGCSHDIGRGWRCVLDIHRGHGDGRIVLFPAPKQEDVPTTGSDRIENRKNNPGFPISVTFPDQANLRKVQAVLTDADDKELSIHVTTPEKPLNVKQPRGIIGVHPLEPLQPGRTYFVTVSVINNGTEWRERWQFTTAK